MQYLNLMKVICPNGRAKVARLDQPDPQWDRDVALDIVKDSPGSLKSYQLNGLQDQASSPVRRDISSRCAFF